MRDNLSSIVIIKRDQNIIFVFLKFINLTNIYPFIIRQSTRFMLALQNGLDKFSANIDLLSHVPVLDICRYKNMVKRFTIDSLFKHYLIGNLRLINFNLIVRGRLSSH